MTEEATFPVDPAQKPDTDTSANNKHAADGASRRRCMLSVLRWK